MFQIFKTSGNGRTERVGRTIETGDHAIAERDRLRKASRNTNPGGSETYGIREIR